MANQDPVDWAGLVVLTKSLCFLNYVYSTLKEKHQTQTWIVLLMVG